MSASVLDPDDDESLLADINVTPLVDVVLVLLIIFMITAPMLTMSLDVNLPQVTAAAPAPRSTIVVTISKDGGVSIDGQPMSVEQAIERVKDRRAQEEGAVYLRGDRDAAFGSVLSVLDGFLRAGLTDVQIVTVPAVEPAPPAKPKKK